MPYEQFISRNHSLLAQVISEFHELNGIMDDNLVLYLDQKYWEIFDTRRAIPIIRHEFKHLTNMLSDIKAMIRAVGEIEYCRMRVSSGKNPTTTQSCAFRKLFQIYGNDTYFFNSKMLEYYGKND